MTFCLIIFVEKDSTILLLIIITKYITFLVKEHKQNNQIVILCPLEGVIQLSTIIIYYQQITNEINHYFEVQLIVFLISKQ